METRKMDLGCSHKPDMKNVPRLQSESASAMAGKLLRRPRAPKRAKTSPERTARTEAKSVEGYQLDTLRPMTDFSVAETTARSSPVASGVHSLVSPPPPSEATHKKSVCYDYRDFNPNIQTRGAAFITKDDKKYVLDPVYREKTMTAGTPNRDRLSQQGVRTAGSRTFLGGIKPRGPDGLLLREPRRKPDIVRDYADMTDDARYVRPPEFTMETFLIDMPEIQKIPMMKVKQAIYSRHHYKKIVELLRKDIQPQCRRVNKVDISAEDLNIPVKEPRIPQRQLLVELAAVIKQHVRETMNTEVKSVIKPLPKYLPSAHQGQAPHTEIVLYEDPASSEQYDHFSEESLNDVPNQDAVFSLPRSSFFQGSARSGSPFMGDAVISPSEVAILDSLVSGGTALSLKAHFICVLPDISPVMTTVTYLNLSFNDFTSLPEEVLDLAQLEVLKLRNNPIVLLPEGMEKLSNLRVFVASFCLLNSLPDGLCSLKKLVHVNVSYNRLSELPRGMGNLKDLRELIVEGNQLPALPMGALQLSKLHALNVRNNFMHPLFWKDYTQDIPQKLVDLTALAIHSHKLHEHVDQFPETVKTILTSNSTCDCCHGPLFGPGVRLIRPVTKMFGVNHLPFMFLACTAQCKSRFMGLSKSLSESLYGEEVIQAES